MIVQSVSKHFRVKFIIATVDGCLAVPSALAGRSFC